MAPLLGLIAIFASQSVFKPHDSPAVKEQAAALVTVLDFKELIVADGTGGLKPSPRALGLEGKRVQVTGFMADIEEMPRGGFYLCPLPVHGDESGAGLGDLPPHAIAVLVKEARNRQFLPQKRRVIVTGIFHVGAPSPPDDFAGAFRIVADPASTKRSRPTVGGPRKTSPLSVRHD